ncbi:MAG TPA: acyl-CoA dehydrogenase, partial [Rhodanobacter sp.]|nr:acyl-CoA dehydrogenase [Rhodanobacter sp.]
SKSSDQLLRRYGKQAADQQHAQKRLADIAIDLFIGLCVLSRAHSLEQQSHAAADEAVSIAEIFTRQARRRMARNVRGLERNEDAAIEQLAGTVLANGGYMWDVF